MADEALSVASAAAGLDDLSSPLRWLAWRHPALEAYEPRWSAGGPEVNKEALGGVDALDDPYIRTPLLAMRRKRGIALGVQ